MKNKMKKKTKAQGQGYSEFAGGSYGYSELTNKLQDMGIFGKTGKSLKGEKHMIEFNPGNGGFLGLQVSQTTGPGTQIMKKIDVQSLLPGQQLKMKKEYAQNQTSASKASMKHNIDYELGSHSKQLIHQADKKAILTTAKNTVSDMLNMRPMSALNNVIVMGGLTSKLVGDKLGISNTYGYTPLSQQGFQNLQQHHGMLPNGDNKQQETATGKAFIMQKNKKKKKKRI